MDAREKENFWREDFLHPFRDLARMDWNCVSFSCELT
jgi:hypothetical protein